MNGVTLNCTFFVDFLEHVSYCVAHMTTSFPATLKFLFIKIVTLNFFFRSDSNENYHSIIPIFVRVAFMVWGSAYTVGLKLKKGQ